MFLIKKAMSAEVLSKVGLPASSDLILFSKQLFVLKGSENSTKKYK